jgi:hypothetical protein
MTNDLPPTLKRDANNVAPFMIDWEKTAELRKQVVADAHLYFVTSPAASPQETPPSWVPPWGAKSPPPDA